MNPDVGEQIDVNDETVGAVRALRAAAAHVDHMLARALEQHDLTPAQFAVLEVMDELKEQDVPCSELGRRLAGPGPDVTRLLDRLESGGLVARYRDSKDRRVVHTRITEQGLILLQKVRPDVRAAESKALSDLPAEDRRRLAAILQVVKRGCPGTGN